MSKTKYLNVHTTSNNESFTIHGCGKFNESKKTLTKVKGALLYCELHKWMFDKNE